MFIWLINGPKVLDFGISQRGSLSKRIDNFIQGIRVIGLFVALGSGVKLMHEKQLPNKRYPGNCSISSIQGKTVTFGGPGVPGGPGWYLTFDRLPLTGPRE